MSRKFSIDKGGSPWVTKKSIYNQFYSDLVTKVQHGIDVPGTTIHVFYATKMGEKYEQRYLTYFKNPDIHRHDSFEKQHSEKKRYTKEQYLKLCKTNITNGGRYRNGKYTYNPG